MNSLKNAENGNIYTDRTASALEALISDRGRVNRLTRDIISTRCSYLTIDLDLTTTNGRVVLIGKKRNLKFDNGTKNGEAEKPTEQR